MKIVIRANCLNSNNSIDVMQQGVSYGGIMDAENSFLFLSGTWAKSFTVDLFMSSSWSKDMAWSDLWF